MYKDKSMHSNIIIRKSKFVRKTQIILLPYIKYRKKIETLFGKQHFCTNESLL